MDQIYWVSNPTVAGTDTRKLVYRYGRFCYAGNVITEPIHGLDYLPGVLQGIQAVQGQIPYLSEHKDLAAGSDTQVSLAYVERAMHMLYKEMSAHEEALAALAKKGNAWLDEEDAAVYFEFETLPGYTLNGSDVVFAKSFRGEVMMNVIWYGVGLQRQGGGGRGGGAGGGSFFVTLCPAGGEEQSLVDTQFPQIYGKRRGVELHSYSGSRGVYVAGKDVEYARKAGAAGGTGAQAVAEDGKEAEEGGGGLLDPTTLFARVSVWESSEDVPDPDEIRARDEEAEAGLLDGGGAGDISAVDGVQAGDGEEEGPVVDVSGGEGYTQVYAVMQPAPDGPRVPAGDGLVLVPRQAAFRFGSWIYAGTVHFPVDTLRLGDVPYVLPAVQKQQGRLAFLAEATGVPASHPMTGVLHSFMAAIAILKEEMEDAQEEVAELAQQSVNAWIDEEWAASFFELSFVPASIEGSPAHDDQAGRGLAGAEVIAAKVYLFGGTGVVLHCVWFGSSLFCVLADSVEDLPLLDVAFPDVTARNRVVQVRAYEERTARKLSAAHPGAPMPKALRVWEGRRKGVPGVGHGAAAAIAGAGQEAEEIRRRAAERAARQASAQATATASAGGGSGPGSTAGSAGGKGKGGPAQEGKVPEAGAAGGGKAAEEDDGADLYDVGGLKASLAAGGGGGAGAGGGGGGGASAAAKAGGTAGAASMPTQLIHNSASLARAPHHVAPLTRGGPTSFGARGSAPLSASEGGGESSGMGGNRLMGMPSTGGTSNSKEEEAPWDASGKPKGR